jgi:hypothetical protein
MDFAKIFNVPAKGQILVVISTNDENCPCINFVVKPRGFRICMKSISFPATKEGYDLTRKTFESIEEEDAIVAVEPLFKEAVIH